MIALPSTTRPHLIRSLAERIAEIGRLPYLGTLEYAGGAAINNQARLARGSAGSGQQNSAHRLAAVWPALTIPAQVGGAVAGLAGPVLLVDDRLETGWTMTAAARLLRAAGATAVLPLVLAVTAG